MILALVFVLIGGAAMLPLILTPEKMASEFVRAVTGTVRAPFRIGSFRYQSLRGFEARDIVLGPPPGFSEDMLRIERVDVRYRVLPLLLGRITVESVAVERPTVVAEARDGQLNWAVLMRARTSTPTSTVDATETSTPGWRMLRPPLRLALERLAIGPVAVRTAGALPDVALSGLHFRGEGRVGPDRLSTGLELRWTSDEATPSLRWREGQSTMRAAVDGHLRFRPEAIFVDGWRADRALLAHDVRVRVERSDDAKTLRGAVESTGRALLALAEDRLHVPGLRVRVGGREVFSGQLEVGGLSKWAEGAGLGSAWALWTRAPQGESPRALSMAARSDRIQLGALSPWLAAVVPGARLGGEIALDHLSWAGRWSDWRAGAPTDFAGAAQWRALRLRLPRLGVRVGPVSGRFESRIDRASGAPRYVLEADSAIDSVRLPGHRGSALRSTASLALDPAAGGLGAALSVAAGRYEGAMTVEQAGLSAALRWPAAADTVRVTARIGTLTASTAVARGLLLRVDSNALAWLRGLAPTLDGALAFDVDRWATPVAKGRALRATARSAVRPEGRGLGFDGDFALVHGALQADRLALSRWRQPGTFRGSVSALTPRGWAEMHADHPALRAAAPGVARWLSAWAAAPDAAAPRYQLTLESDGGGHGGIASTGHPLPLRAGLSLSAAPHAVRLRRLGLRVGRSSLRANGRWTPSPGGGGHVSTSARLTVPALSEVRDGVLGGAAALSLRGAMEASLQARGRVRPNRPVGPGDFEGGGAISFRGVDVADAARGLALSGLGGELSGRLQKGAPSVSMALHFASFSEKTRALFARDARAEAALGYAGRRWTASLAAGAQALGLEAKAPPFGAEFRGQVAPGGDLVVERASLSAPGLGLFGTLFGALRRGRFGVLTPSVEAEVAVSLDALERVAEALGVPVDGAAVGAAALAPRSARRRADVSACASAGPVGPRGRSVGGTLRGHFALQSESPERLRAEGTLTAEDVRYSDGERCVIGLRGVLPLRQRFHWPAPRWRPALARTRGILGDDLEARVAELAERAGDARLVLDDRDIFATPERHGAYVAMRPHFRAGLARLRVDRAVHQGMALDAVALDAAWRSGVLTVPLFSAGVLEGDVYGAAELQLSPDENFRARVRGAVTELNTDLLYAKVRDLAPVVGRAKADYLLSGTMALGFSFRERALNAELDLKNSRGRGLRPVVARIMGLSDSEGAQSAVGALALSDRAGVRPTRMRVWISQNLLNLTFDWTRLYFHVHYESAGITDLVVDSILPFIRPVLIPTLGTWVIRKVNGGVRRFSVSNILDEKLAASPMGHWLEVLSARSVPVSAMDGAGTPWAELGGPRRRDAALASPGDKSPAAAAP